GPHDGAGVHGMTSWSPRLEVVFVVGALTLLYARGVRTLWSTAGRGRSIRRRQVWAFAVGVAALLVALASPVDVIAEELAWVHMLQHELLLMVAAPLLVLGSTLNALLWSLPRRGRHAFARWTGPLRRWR